MTESNEPNVTIPNIDVIDPLGEIRRLATTLWKEDGKPPDKDWSNYWSQAEEMMISVGEGGSTKQRTKRKIDAESITPEIQKLIEQSDNILVSIILSAVGRRLTSHEILCLALLWKDMSVTLTDGSSHGPYPLDEILNTLATVASEYGNEFAQQNHSADPNDVDIDKRAAYWRKRVEEFYSDRMTPTNADVNTMDRLQYLLSQETRVTNIHYEIRPENV